MTSLAERHDAALLDLDGTVYLGGVVIPHVAEAIAAAGEHGMTAMYITNNASRPPAVVAQALQGMGVPARPQDVLTSPEAAADLLAAAHPAGSPVLIVGTDHLSACVEAVGLRPVRVATDEPVAVVQGLSQTLGWPELAEACIAIRAGADWVATNVDATLPTDRGMLPGNGSLVAALVTATGLTPRVAGKPERPLLDAAVRRSGARSPLVVGDRLDTDIEAAVTAGMPSLMPLTGVNTAQDVLAAPPERRPTHVCLDLRGLVDDARSVQLTDPAAAHGWQLVPTDAGDGHVELRSDPGAGFPHDDAAALSALAVLAGAAWSGTRPAAVHAGDDAARTALAALRIGDGAPLH